MQHALSRAGVLAVRALMAVVARVPLGASLWLARRLADAALALGLRRETILRNLDYVYGDELSPARKRQIARACQRNLFCTAVEILRAANPRTARDTASRVRFDDPALIRSCDEDPRAVLFVVAHSGNFDLSGVWWTHFCRRPIGVAMKPLENPVFNDLLVRTRRAFGWRVISTKSPRAIWEINDQLRRGHHLCLLPDQNARRRGAVVDFCGRPASTYKGPAAAYLRNRDRTRLVVAVPTREPDGLHHLIRIREIDDFQPSGERSQDVVALTARIAEVMGALVRAHPESYLWHHRRWGKAPWQKTA